MVSAFASIFAQQFSSFCLKKNLRLVTLLPKAVTGQDDDPTCPTYSFLLDKKLLPDCEDWMVRQQHYSIVFRHLAADHTSYWLHDITQSEIIHIRLVHRIAYAGITLLETHAIQQRAVFNQLFYHPDPVDQALILLLQYGFKERNHFILNKYVTLLQEILPDQDVAIMEKMIDLFGVEHALEVENRIHKQADIAALLQLSRMGFLYRSWMRIGGDLYHDMISFMLDSVRCKMRNIKVKIVLQGTSKQRKNDLSLFLQNEFRSFYPYLDIADKTVPPLIAHIMRFFVILVCLDRNSLKNAFATNNFTHGLVLPHEIGIGRSRALLRNHVIARLDQYFSDNPV